MAWIHESSGRGNRVLMYVIALMWVAGGSANILWGKEPEQQTVYPVLCLIFAGIFVTLARGEKGHTLSVDEARFRWRWHLGGRGWVGDDVPVSEVVELHHEWEPLQYNPHSRRHERRRVQQVFVVLADGSRRLLPPNVLRDWAKLVSELRAVRPDLKVVERETDDFTGASP